MSANDVRLYYFTRAIELVLNPMDADVIQTDLSAAGNSRSSLRHAHVFMTILSFPLRGQEVDEIRNPDCNILAVRISYFVCSREFIFLG